MSRYVHLLMANVSGIEIKHNVPLNKCHLSKDSVDPEVPACPHTWETQAG